MSLPSNPTIAPKLPTLGFFDRLKARLARGRAASQDANRVSELTAEFTQKLENSRDLRFKQGELLKKQLRWRLDAPLRRLVLREQTLAYRARIRRPQESAIVRDVFAAEDSHGDALYMSLSNGQLLRADKPHRNPVLRDLVTNRLREDTAGAVNFETKLAPSFAQ